MRHRLTKAITAPLAWAVRGVAGKTSWEWLELLIVPLFLAGGAFYLETRVESRQERIAAERYEQETQISDEQAKQAVLDNYLEKMQGLLLDRELRDASIRSEVGGVARAITTTAIKDLDAERNALLIIFLREAILIDDGSSSEQEEADKFSLLPGLNLSNTNLANAKLNKADLREANLRETNLRHANLNNADLTWANLTRADLTRALLGNANLSYAELNDASLQHANLMGANLNDANLSGANLNGANLLIPDFMRNAPVVYRNGAKDATLVGADLTSANLSEAKIEESQIRESILCKTRLPGGFEIDPNRDCKNN